MTVAAAAAAGHVMNHEMYGYQQPDADCQKVPGLMLLLHKTTRQQTQRVK